MDELLTKLEAKVEECFILRQQIKSLERRVKALEEHLGERNKEKIWASTNVILSQDY